LSACRAALLESLVCLFELPEDSASAEEDLFFDAEESSGYSATFNQLFSAARKQSDPFNGQVPDAKAYLAHQLATMSNNVSFSVSAEKPKRLNSPFPGFIKFHIDSRSITSESKIKTDQKMKDVMLHLSIYVLT
jgi:hypothetical protein